MKTESINYKNIDKSTITFFDEKNQFSIINYSNSSKEVERFSFNLDNNCIKLFFNIKGKSKVAFNMEHCAVQLNNDDSSLVYFKDEQVKLLFEIMPNSQLAAVFISVQYFHSLFASEEDLLYNFNNFKTNKPIIEQNKITPVIKVVLNQLFSKKLNTSLRPIYIKGKVYELLSVYFSNNEENGLDHCPFIENEETITQLKKVKDIVIENMANPPSLDEISKLVGLNLKKIKEGFKELYGFPVFTFLLNYKMETAKKLLLENKLNVNEIATNLGYSTSSHFISAFKKKYGVTPKQFAKL